ncbi:uncharacterized protein SAPINGB_P004769 [Magnusiomyces paraingens]|uniref:Kinetochore protein Spc24 n=1 Tax=Magnusiomyces paraingens TaxID=2606893 RepID=A0A5E8BYY5_9ASCO|nr:uncharacterized protein SAPINGB_P004769 [Saprochaete ingens]VVT55849.1 unnamed protein product [Saprochaete ingens]
MVPQSLQTGSDEPLSVTQNLLDFFPAVRQSFDQTDDLDALDRVARAVRELDDGYRATIQGNQTVVRTLSRTFELLRASVLDKESVIVNGLQENSRKKINKNEDNDIDIDVENKEEDVQDAPEVVVLQSLDRKKYELAKHISSLETSNTASNTTLIKLNKELENLIKEDVLDTSVKTLQTSSILKLKVLQSLGVSFDGDSPETHTKALIHSPQSKGIHTLPLGEYSSYFISNYIWENL